MFLRTFLFQGAMKTTFQKHSKFHQRIKDRKQSTRKLCKLPIWHEWKLKQKGLQLVLNDPKVAKELWETDQEVRKETLSNSSKRNFQKARKGVRSLKDRKQSK